MRRLILKSFQSPGDIVMLTAAVRDLHRASPGQFQTDVRTSADTLFEHNPWITKLSERDRKVQTLTMHYPLIHQSNQRPYHFLHGYVQFLEQQLDLRIPVTEFKGDIHLSPEEKQYPPQFAGVELPERYWIMVAGGKYDFTAKWWNPASYQAVVDHFRDKLQFVQCGEQGHWHPPLRGVTNLIGRTNLREFVRLMHFAEGVVCPVTLAMHLAAAVEMPLDRPPRRPCVVIAGGREPTHWEAYPHHQYLGTVGILSCCAEGGCWKSRCQKVGDGDPKDARELCEQPVPVSDGLVIPRCLDMITSDDVIRRIEMYLVGEQPIPRPVAIPTITVLSQPRRRASMSPVRQPLPREIVLRLEGGVEQLLPAAIVRNHVARYHPDWNLAIAHADHQAEFAALLGLPSAPAVGESAHGVTTTWMLNGAAPSRQASPHWPNLPVADWLLQTLKLSPIDDLFRCDFRVPAEAAASLQRRLDEVLGKDSWRLVVLDAVDASEATAWHYVLQEIDPESRTGFLEWRTNSGVLPILRLWGSDHFTNVELTSLSELLAVIVVANLLVARETPIVSLAIGTRTPTVAVWKSQHPVRAVPPVPHMRHLLTASAAMVPLSTAEARYFAGKYRSHIIEEQNNGIAETVRELLTHTPLRERPDPSIPDAVDKHAAPEEPHAVTPVAGPLHEVRFYHGLGDAANFARLIPLYTRRGHRIGVECTPDKEILFRAAGAEITSGASATHDWGYPPQNVHAGHGQDHQGSKIGWNVSTAPLPDIGDRAKLWRELCQSAVRVPPHVPEHEREFIRQWLQALPTPVVLLHTIGNTNQSVKSLHNAVTQQLYRELLDRCDGTVVALDWDNRAPRLASYRFRHLTDMSDGCNSARMFALMDQSDLVIGVDSGPLHAAGLTDTPRVGLWMPGHYPARYSLPDPRQLNLVLSRPTEQWNRYRRVPWNIVDQPGANWDAAWIAEKCVKMLAPPRYLEHFQIAADVQLQHWIDTLCPLCRLLLRIRRRPARHEGTRPGRIADVPVRLRGERVR